MTEFRPPQMALRGEHGRGLTYESILMYSCIMPTPARRNTRSSPLDDASASAIADAFKVLADATRVRIIAAIFDKERCVHDLCVELELEQSAVSHQLRALRNQGLVRHRKAGRHVYYALDDDHVKALFAVAREHAAHSTRRR